MSLAAFVDEAAIASGAAELRGAASTVAFDRVSVAYRGAVVLKPLTLEVAAGEILAMIGPSGSGKTTALRAVAGFVRPASGRIRIGGADVTDLPPYARGLAWWCRTTRCFRTCASSTTSPSACTRAAPPKALVEARVAEALRVVGMAQYARRYPRELSGGQQQRVAIARALAVRPRVLLLDEPLSALDAQIRRSMVEEIARLHAELPDLTMLYVTHDQSEALTLADRIAILQATGRSARSGGRGDSIAGRPIASRRNSSAAPTCCRSSSSPTPTPAASSPCGSGDERLVVPGADEPRRRAAAVVRAAAERDVRARRRAHEPARRHAARNPLAGRAAPICRSRSATRCCASSRRGCRRFRPRGERLEMFFAPADASLIAEDADV